VVDVVVRIRGGRVRIGRAMDGGESEREHKGEHEREAQTGQSVGDVLSSTEPWRSRHVGGCRCDKQEQ
jgi:hypothetical protein